MTQGDPQHIAGVHEGQILAGKYRVEKVLGAGGMGVVVAARHIELESRVALKFLSPGIRSNREAVLRFAAEARRAVKFHSEHVARVLDVGTLDDGAPYMVMELLEGSDLSTWLQERGRLPIDQAVEFVLQACVAVADAHSLGIIHRDLKPANLFCVRRTDGQLSIKVLDFGISKMAEAASGSQSSGMASTKTATVMGSPLYMSPEQIQSAKDVDARTDIWSLGVVLFELLTGAVPFEGDAFGQLAVKIAVQTPAPVRGYRPDVPDDLEAVIATCLAKDRNRRYPNVAELALALSPFAPKRAKTTVERIVGIIQAAGLSQSALAMPPSPPLREETLLSPGSVAPDSIAPGSVAPWSDTMPGRRSKRAILWALAGCGTLGAALALGLLLRSPITPPSVAISKKPPVAAGGRPTAIEDTPSAAVDTAAPHSAESTPPIETASPTVEPTASPSPHVDTGLQHPAHHAPGFPNTNAFPSSVPRTPSGHASTPAPRPDCDPPFTLDDQGFKHFKRECYPK
jgi:serine/threonine-protein kinase